MVIRNRPPGSEDPVLLQCARDSIAFVVYFPISDFHILDYYLQMNSIPPGFRPTRVGDSSTFAQSTSYEFCPSDTLRYLMCIHPLVKSRDQRWINHLVGTWMILS